MLQNKVIKFLRYVRRMDKKQKTVLVLLSGGIDSTACLNYYLKEKFDVIAVFIDYGQKAKTNELKSAKKIAEYYKVRLEEITLQTKKIFSIGEIIGRNAFLIISAIMYAPEFKGLISLGIHSGTIYYDCSESFVKSMNEILIGYTNGQVELDTPLLKWDKYMIYQYCKDNKIPIHLTYSCENGGEPTCGSCLSCLDRRILDA